MSGGEVLLRITISGAPGSGTSTLVRKIQHTTGWSALNGGEVFRTEAKRRNLTVGEFSELCKQDLDVDRSLDRLLKDSMTKTDGPEIIESRLAGWWANELAIIASGYGSIHLMKKGHVESKIEKVEALNKDWSSHLLDKMLTRKDIVIYMILLLLK